MKEETKINMNTWFDEAKEVQKYLKGERER